MALFCFIYDVEFRNLVEEKKHDVEVDLTRKVDIILADPPYNVRNDQKYDRAEYDTVGSNDMRDIARVPEDVLKPGEHRPVFCTAPQFFLLYRTFALENVKTGTVAVTIPERVGLIGKRMKV